MIPIVAGGHGRPGIVKEQLRLGRLLEQGRGPCGNDRQFGSPEMPGLGLRVGRIKIGKEGRVREGM